MGHNYLVMELIQGDTLTAVLRKGPLPLAQVVTYGAQIADALAAAHERGITHRDLKPGNVMLTKIGAKILDFGLAKMTPSEDTTLTASQAVMGTPAYMAPEQRAGRACDGRTDIFALGLVLYEMATGKRLTQGRPLEGVPENLAPVIERCVAQDPDDRWHAAKDVKTVLEWAAGNQREASISAAKRSWLAWAIAGVAVTALIGTMIWTRGRSEITREPVQFSFEPPADTSLVESGVVGAGLSPDGQLIAFVAQPGQ